MACENIGNNAEDYSGAQRLQSSQAYAVFNAVQVHSACSRTQAVEKSTLEHL